MFKHAIESRQGTHVHLNNYYKLLQGFWKVMVKSSIPRISDRRKLYRTIFLGQGMQKKKKAQTIDLENGKAIELKLTKHDGALQELKEFWSACKFAF